MATNQARVSSVPLTLLAVGGSSMRAVLRRVDEKLADQAARNAAGCLAQAAAARRDHDLTVSELGRLEHRVPSPYRAQASHARVTREG